MYNPKNTDNKCILWCLMKNLYQHHPINSETNLFISEKKQKRVEEIFKKYFILNNFSFPLSTKDLEKFEKVNEISINVYIIGKTKKIEPLHITNKRGRNIQICF